MPTLSLTPVSPGFFPAPDALQWVDGMIFTDPMLIDDGTGDWSISPGVLALSVFTPGVL